MLEKDDLGLVKAEILVVHEELLGSLPSRTAGHDVPRDLDTRARVSARDDLQSGDAFGLILE